MRCSHQAKVKLRTEGCAADCRIFTYSRFFAHPSLTFSLVTQLSKHGPLPMLHHGLHRHGMLARILFFAL